MIVCADIYHTIFEFLNLNDLKSLLTTSAEMSSMARNTIHYKECIKYGMIFIEEYFIEIVKRGNIYVCKYIYRFKNTNIYIIEAAFIRACMEGYLAIAQWLIEIEKNYYYAGDVYKINIHVFNDFAFTYACKVIKDVYIYLI